jgi:Leucine-rich repeat (LRR) protein
MKKYMTDMKAEMIVDTITNLKAQNAVVVDLSHNKLTEEHINNICQIESIEKLTLLDCGLTEIPEAIKKLKKLKVLNLGFNKITKIPAWFNTMSSLETIELCCNNISEIEVPDWSGLSNLTILALEMNKGLKILPTGLEKTLIKILTVDLCDITELPEKIGEAPNLMAVAATLNPNLKNLPESLLLSKTLNFVTVSGTGLTINQITDYKKRGVKPQIIYN